MHKLQRGNAPVCLANYRHGRDNWSKVTSGEKATIWTELEAMQGQRCGYCEADISNGQKHIEHFRQKGRDATVTFLWSTTCSVRAAAKTAAASTRTAVRFILRQT